MRPPLHVSYSRAYPVSLDDAFSHTLVLPLDQLFCRRFGPLPPIASTTQDGVWSTAGQVRTIHTADGGSMREQLVEVDRPNSFSYELSEVTGPMKPLASRVEGRWTFEEVGTGARVTWSWTVHPASKLSGLILPIFGKLWTGYARRSFETLEQLLLEATA